MVQDWIKNTLKKMKTKKRKNNLMIVEKEIRETIKVPGLSNIPKLDLAIKPDYDKLIMLLDMRTYSKSSLQDRLIDKLKEHFELLGGTTRKDKYGNLYVTKGTAEFYPCVVGHTDINQTVRNNVKIMTAYPWMFGFDADKAEQAGIGADDKVGVYFAVHMFDLFENIKLFFPKDEEVGLVGTYQADQTFFEDCSMLVQLDRNSYKNDLITYTNGITVCSDEFVKAADSIMDKYMYKTNNGSCTDIGGIKKFDKVNCVAMNVSCGYINEHDSDEVISIPHFENAINFGYELLKLGVDKMWNHKSEVPVYENTYGRGWGGYDYLAPRSTMQVSRDHLFADEFGMDENTQHSVVSSPGGILELDNDYSEHDGYLTSMYPELIDPETRKTELTHRLGYSDKSGVELISQSDIDDCIADGCCPNCWGDVAVDNRLLLYTECDYCETMWNIPKDNETN